MKQTISKLCKLKETAPKFLFIRDSEVIYKGKEYLCQLIEDRFEVCVHGKYETADISLFEIYEGMFLN